MLEDFESVLIDTDTLLECTSGIFRRVDRVRAEKSEIERGFCLEIMETIWVRMINGLLMRCRHNIYLRAVKSSIHQMLLNIACR